MLTPILIQYPLVLYVKKAKKVNECFDIVVLNDFFYLVFDEFLFDVGSGFVLCLELSGKENVSGFHDIIGEDIV